MNNRDKADRTVDFRAEDARKTGCAAVRLFVLGCILSSVAFTGCVSCGDAEREIKAKGEDNMRVVRIAEIEVYPEWLDAYLAAAGTVGAESVAKEPGVVCIFPMQKKESPTSIRIVEIYRSEEAYKAHLATPHFRAYKEGTPHMIKSLALVPMHPLDDSGMKQIFKKENEARKGKSK